MSDKTENTRFNKAPTITERRTKFDLCHNVLTTGSTGEFIPVLCEPVNPGETFSLKTASLTRLETSLHQTMDNAYVEFAYFFVPNDIIWSHWNEFNGANDDPWTQTQNYTIPQIKLTASSTSATCATGSLLNHLMIPVGGYGSGDTNSCLTVSALPLRAVFEVWNQYYRDENFDSIVAYSKGDLDVHLNEAFVFNGSYYYPAQTCLKVNRLKDLFSSCLPAPQKGAAVSFGMSGLMPVIAKAGGEHSMGAATYFYGMSGTSFVPAFGKLYADGTGKFMHADDRSAAEDPLWPEGTDTGYIDASNLYVDSASASAITVNDLRLAIVRQLILERNARTGTRPKEVNYGKWGVITPDLELDRPEFLGGKRIPVSMMEVLQTSETDTTVLGHNAGVSKTVDYSDGFIKSFTKAGWILGFVYVRTDRSYSQGIDRRFRDKSIWDCYDPLMDNIGEVGVKKSELYALGTTNGNTAVNNAEAVFGYQEAWYHLKERCNRFSGYFQSGISGTLDSWHYGDDYNALPSLSASWLKETADQVDRTIAVQSSTAFQWRFSIHFELHATRPMAKYSIPNTFGF